MKQNVLIVGLVDNIGGREIEVRNIIVALSEKYNIRLLSLLQMPDESVAIKDLDCNATTIFKELYDSSLILKAISFVSKLYNKSKLPTHFFIENNLNKKLFNIFNRKVAIMEKEINSSDAVLYCGVLDLQILNKMLIYCNRINKPIVLRTTGEIIKVNDSIQNLLPKASSILVHSKNNSKLLDTITPENIHVIDQTTLQEKELLKIPIPIKKELVFGYLGRFSKEKGIIELLRIFKNNNFKIIVAGSGNLENEVLDLIDDKNDFLSELSPENINVFFNKIDVLVISSHEESGPLVGIEAMAAGKIIFSTKVGAMEERLQDTGNNFWFDINNKESLLREVEKLKLKFPEEINEIRKANREKYLKKYSISIVSKKYLDTFENIFSSKK